VFGAKRLDIGFAVDVDEVDCAAIAAVHVLKIVNDADAVDVVGYVLALF